MEAARTPAFAQRLCAEHRNWSGEKNDLRRSVCAKSPTHIFKTPRRIPGILTAWSATFAFALQIFFDFSGYTDIAIGSAGLLGFHFPKNFERPYLAGSVTEFWRRWHMSLSRWLRDYLYIPLGGNRRGRWMTYRNLMFTMLLGGLWHGASWNFLLWGGWHGAHACAWNARWGDEKAETRRASP